MAKRRGNPNWGKPEPIGPIVPTITEFEQVVREYKLAPDQYLRSTRLREWARRNKNSKVHPGTFVGSMGFRNRIHPVIRGQFISKAARQKAASSFAEQFLKFSCGGILNA